MAKNRKNSEAPDTPPAPQRDDLEQPSGMSLDVQVNTDSSIEGSESLTANIVATVSSALARFSDRLSRVEVHLTDQNRGKGGSDDKRCMIEARVEGLQPIAVTATAGTVTQAVEAAVRKAARSIESTLGKLRDRRPMPADDDGEGEVASS